jgi:hypothetical protein
MLALPLSPPSLVRILIPAILLLATVLTVGVLPSGATPGVFQGRVVDGSAKEAGTYIYVEGRNRQMRRVNIRKAKVFFAAEITPIPRDVSAADCLRGGAEVRVMAEQGSNGEWLAREITILRLAQQVRRV